MRQNWKTKKNRTPRCRIKKLKSTKFTPTLDYNKINICIIKWELGKKNPSTRWDLNPRPSRDLVGCSNHWATGLISLIVLLNNAAQGLATKTPWSVFFFFFLGFSFDWSRIQLLHSDWLEHMARVLWTLRKLYKMLNQRPCQMESDSLTGLPVLRSLLSGSNLHACRRKIYTILATRANRSHVICFGYIFTDWNGFLCSLCPFEKLAKPLGLATQFCTDVQHFWLLASNYFARP